MRLATKFCSLTTAFSALLMTGVATGAPNVQCPEDTDGDGVPDTDIPGVRCYHYGAGDSFIHMADGRSMYIFGYIDLTDRPISDAFSHGLLASTFPAPTLTAVEGEEVYLTLTNIGMFMRPDLPDPHTIHWHGFPNASSVFDGLPESGISINMGASLTYYYNVQEPGTFMYHCHVEAAEHMQMGMLGNLWIEPRQNYDTPNGTVWPNGVVHTTCVNGAEPPACTKYVYNDGDGSTYYDVEYPVQLGSFDPVFHDAALNVHPLPFADMRDTYPMINGRGYPDTIRPGAIVPAPVETGLVGTGRSTQEMDSIISAQQGQRILLRITNLNITSFHTVTSLGLPMRVVGRGTKQLRGRDGQDLSYETTTVTLGGGEAMEVMIDTTGVPPGTYHFYTTNLNELSNDQEDFGGMMTEIRITP